MFCITKYVRLLLQFILLAAFQGSLWAQTPVIFADAARPDDAGDGRSWATAKKTLQAAIDATQTTHQIWAKAGTYAEAITLKDYFELYGGFAGTETDLFLRSVNANPTVIDGSTARGGLPAYHIVTMADSSNAKLDGFTITGGDARETFGNLGSGGGIFCGNSSNSHIYNCRIIGNRATETFGNLGSGGGIFCGNSSNSHIYNCRIIGNRATWGGGIAINEAQAYFGYCMIAANNAGEGGGLYASHFSKWSLYGCWIGGNAARTLGGGMCVSSHDTGTRLTNCILSGNTTEGDGGALAWKYAVPGASLLNCTFSDNSAAGHGGGLYLDTEAGSTNVTNCLFDRNAAGDLVRGKSLPAIHGAATINSQMPGAAGNLPGDPAFVTTTVSGTWSDVGLYDAYRGTTSLYDASAHLTPGALAGKTIAIDTSRTVQMLALDNTTTAVLVAGDPSAWINAVGQSWSVVDYHLAAGSAALDAGTSNGWTMDYDGNPRHVTPRDPVHPRVDIGAYEYQGAGATPATHALSLAGAHGTVISDPSGSSFTHGATVLLTPIPDGGYQFAGWSGDVPPGAASANPLPLTMDADKSLTALFAPDPEIVVRIDAASVAADWYLSTGSYVIRWGLGSATLRGVFTTPLTLTWGTVANYDYDLAFANPQRLALPGPGGQLTFRARYTPRLGAVNIHVWPVGTAWSLADGLGAIRSGTGPARLTGVLCGARKLCIQAPAGYLSPQPNPVTFSLGPDEDADLSFVLLPQPGSGDAVLTAARMLRYLLGLSANAAGLDVNGDQKINAADLIRTIKEAKWNAREK